MKKLEKIYEVWSMNHSDTADILRKWCELDTYLYDVCADSIRENIEDYIMECGKLLEKQSFISGFELAFQLWAEICCER